MAEPIKKQFQDAHKNDPSEQIHPHALRTGIIVKVKLASPGIDFGKPVTLPLSNFHTIYLIGKPNDACQPGIHNVAVTLSDVDTNLQHVSLNFPVEVVDFIFDHVSPHMSTTCSSF
jgi:hypothetical protein